MLLTLRTRVLSVLTVTLALAASGCGDEGNDPGGVTPGDIEQLLEDNLGDVSAIGDGMTRLIAALQGNPQPGVTLTPITNGVQGSVGLDLDGNGSLEATVNGTLVYIDPNIGIAAGATLTVTSIEGAATDGTLTVAVVPLSATDLAFGPGGGEFDPPGSGNIVTINQISFVADVASPAPVLDGFGTFSVEEEPGSIFFEDDGHGGWQIRVVFADDEIIVP
jgi:hypothetical protein